MNATIDHCSLETGKLLSDCGVESKYIFIDEIFRDDGRYYTHIILREELFGLNVNKIYPAYTWQEILWEHAEEFFGDKEMDTDLYYCSRVWQAWNYGTMTKNDFEENLEPAFVLHTNQIIKILQQKKYDEADLYFRENCVLIKKL